ncbi:MAG: aspartate aminotransferase family protein [Planctomycetes bacterium]|nr:aspartate aminotransferase family protein [Planctomycetota bacterium]
MATLTESSGAAKRAAEKLTALFRQRTPRSAELAREAKSLLPSGIAHDSRYLEPYSIYVERAAGSRKWDVDGNEYVDYAGGHGALLLGHNPPAVVEAVNRQLALGTHFGTNHPLELRWARLIQQLMPSAERVRFTASGTEATLLALRLARAFTGRSKVVRFLGHFHGWHDHMAFGVTSHFDGTPTPGVLPELAHEILLARPNDIAGVEALLARGDVAAVIIEPTGGSWGQTPIVPEFVGALREATTRHGALLILDEVITGFRCSPGGAQQVLGVTPDLTTLAKIVAGGLPGGAVVGRREVLDLLDFAASAQAGREKVGHQGTFNANPLSAAAGIATIEIVAQTDACARANDYAARLREALQRVVRDEQLPWVVYGTYSGFHIFTNPDRLPVTAADIEAGRVDYQVLKRVDRQTSFLLRLGMLAHGVEIFSWPGGPTSSVHNGEDLQRTVEAFRATVQALRE